jgi:hypothetical protein
MIVKLRIIIVLFVIFSCNNGPKVISSDTNKKSDENSGVFNDKPYSEIKSIPNQSSSDEIHKIIVLEILPTTKYVYLKVKENDEPFWIATIKQNIEIGGAYYYKGGLLKTNFESKEHNKTFEKIYLVTSLVQSNHGNENNSRSLNTKEKEQEISNTSKTNPVKNIPNPGSIKISELVNNIKKYEGKTVQLSGKCVKINPNIMGRNWIHLKDGSNDDFDLVITSDTFVKEGSAITIKAIVSLNKDFGAGYKYDIILENGIVIQ